MFFHYKSEKSLKKRIDELSNEDGNNILFWI